MPKKKTPATTFGARLYEVRVARGFTQVQLAQALGVTQRSISYYEATPGYPPVPVLVEIAKILKVGTDDLLGLSVTKQPKPKKESPTEQRLWKKFRKVLALPTKDQRAVIRLINSIAATAPSGNRRTSGD